MNYLLPDRLDRLAREYVLGTLTPRARRRFQRVLLQSPDASQAVGTWQQRLGQLSTHLPPIAPRDSTWRGLEQRLFGAPAAGGVRQPSWWARWLSAHTLAGTLAGVLLCTVVLRLQPGLVGLEPQGEALPASYVGLLTDAEGQATVLASSRRQGQVLTVKLLRPLTVPAGQVAQLWALPQDGGAPVPLGVVPGSGSVALGLSDRSDRLFFKVSRLAVSLEPASVGAGARPSSPFILSGHCVKLW